MGSGLVRGTEKKTLVKSLENAKKKKVHSLVTLIS